MNQKKISEPAHSSLCRRTFMKLLAQGAIGLGFGVLVFDRGLAFSAAADEDEAHRLLMQGTKDFQGGQGRRDHPQRHVLSHHL